MDTRDKFSRAKLATLLVGTSMLQSLFEKRMDNFMFHHRLKEIGIIKFKPPLWNFLNLYNLCTRGVIKELEPTEGWMACSFNPRDVSLGDDIKRLHGLLEKFNALETNMHEYKSYHEDICRILTDIIKRFSGSEDRDFTNVFQNIMFQGDRDEIVSDLDTILNKDGHANYILQKYESTMNGSKLYTSLESKNDRNDLRNESSTDRKISIARTLSNDDSRNIAKNRKCPWKSTGKYKDKSSRDSHGAKTEGEQIADSLGEKENGVFKLVKWQIYFEFVPPPLNTFDYCMNKLSNIERCLQRMYPNNAAPEAIVPKYMSFAFIHGNHMDLNHASMKLFDAEPERKNDKDNDSRMIIVYLDKDTTFESLEIAIKNTEKLELKRKSGCTFLAVHSEILMQDQSKLRSLMKLILESRIKILDTNKKLLDFYKKFAGVKAQAIKDIENRIKSFKDSFGSTEKLNAVEKQILKLKSEGIQHEDIYRKREKDIWSKPTLSRLKEKGLQGYTTDNNTLILCFQRHSTCSKIIEKMIPFEFKQRFPVIKIIQTEEPLFKYHHSVMGGDKLHPFRHNAGKYGTVGMFGSVSQSDGSSKTVCISSPHVISCGQTAYISDATVPLGNCVWPPIVGNNHINVEDISVIYLDLVHKNIEIQKNFEEQITLFKGDRTNLRRRKVCKFGATTFKTIGFIRDPDFVLTIGDPISVFLIEPVTEDVDDDRASFSQPGDSGAIVFTKFGQNVVALSMIFGGDLTLEGFAENNSIAVDLQQAIQRFKAHNEGQSLQLDTL